MNLFTRLLFLVGLIVSAGVGSYLLYKHHTQLDDHGTTITAAPFFQLVGRVTKHADRVITKITLNTKDDEQAFGKIILDEIRSSPSSLTKDERYLGDVGRYLISCMDASFGYTFLINSSPVPNAFALPGGIVVVTRGLLNMLTSEAQLASILAHEIGHVELGHCADMMRFHIMSNKLKIPKGMGFLDYLSAIVIRHSFSKTQENEADEYGFELIKRTAYDPAATAEAFSLLQQRMQMNNPSNNDSSNIVRDYLDSHPNIKLRTNKFKALAERWWMLHATEHRYRGIMNIKKRKAHTVLQHKSEWIVRVQEPVT